MSFTIAIIGKPNVGKSTLFNRMLSREDRMKARAIAERMPGITRDRNYGIGEWNGKHFTVIDTGGFYPEGLPYEEEDMAKQVREQSLLAIEEADLIIHLLDGKMGLVPSDVEMANMLRVSGKPIYWVVNKIDSASKESLALEFYRIGTSKLFPISAINGLGYSTLMAHIETHIPPSVTSEQNAEHFVDMPKIAVVGRPNVGKSTLINAMLGKKRHIVSPIAGTTRDPIDSICTYYRKPYLFIDTAGIRKKMGSFAKTLKSKEPSGRLDEAAVERLSLIRAVKSIERADIAVIVLDATQGIVEQDQKVAGIVEEFGKSVIVLFNKWDLVTNPEDRYKELREDLEDSFWFLRRVPFLTVSGLNRQRISKLFPLIDTVIADRAKHIQTAKLNKFLERILSAKPFPSYRGREIKFYYIAQTGTNPPAFNLVVNYPQSIKPQHLSYIEKALRDEFGFLGTPLRIYAKSR